MSEMVERVAKRLAANCFGDPSNGSWEEGDWEKVAPHYRESFLKDARDAIATMRDSTLAMQMAAPVDECAQAGDVWRAMIDAALS